MSSSSVEALSLLVVRISPSSLSLSPSSPPTWLLSFFVAVRAPNAVNLATISNLESLLRNIGLVNVLEADALVTMICPESEVLSETVRQHLEDHPENTRLVRRSFQDSDLTTRFGEHTAHSEGDQDQAQEQSKDKDSDTPAVDMVLSAIDDIPLSTHIYNLSKQLRIPVNI